jgi:NAD(P)-dependent dehydrogenase (short-subunit alcohol dehydrogenase family)
MSSGGGGRLTRMTQLLEGKNAIIYGAGGGLGSGVARTFAREGANLFLAGRTREPLEALAAEVGGEVAVLDALDEAAVDDHARSVGRIDVSFNLITRGDVQGTPLIEMTTEQLNRAVTNGLTSTFITARAAARAMVPQSSGVILGLTSGSAKGTLPGMGSTGPADAATEAFLRYLAAEVGPSGVRVLGIYTAGVAETLSAEKLATVNPALAGIDVQQVVQGLASATMLRRAPALDQVAEVAAFLASDRAGALTGTIVNATCGMVPG